MIFATIETSDGRKVEILQLMPMHTWLAGYNMQAYNSVVEHKLDIIPFILQEILIIDGKKTSFEEINTLFADDYMEIMDVCDAMMKKLTKN